MMSHVDRLKGNTQLYNDVCINVSATCLDHNTDIIEVTWWYKYRNATYNSQVTDTRDWAVTLANLSEPGWLLWFGDVAITAASIAFLLAFDSPW